MNDSVFNAMDSVTPPECKVQPGKAGRPAGTHIPVDLIAREFAATKAKDGVILLRHYAGDWFEYNGRCWRVLNDGDLQAQITGYLQRNRAEEFRVSKALVLDVELNLKADSLCGLLSNRYKIPCWLADTQDASGWLTMENGILNIEAAVKCAETGEVVPVEAWKAHTPNLFATFAVPYSFTPGAECPQWHRYLERVLPDECQREAVQMLFGLALVPDTRYNVAFFLYGEGGTGKSVCLHILTKLVGEENVCSIPLSKFANRFGLAPITQRLLNVVGDMPTANENVKLSDVEGALKDITDGALIPVEKKHQDPYSARAIARLVFATNSIPHFTDRSNGLWDRLRIIPFNQIIRGTGEQDKELRFKLEAELPGIFNWALQGLGNLRKLQRFPDTPDGEALKAEHRDVCDHERVFLRETVEEKIGGSMRTKDLYESYRKWTMDNGYRSFAEAKFAQAVKRVFPKAFKDRETETLGKASIYRNIQNISRI